ncbi:unnamed protein product, partial [marine sediment metagenome]
FYNITLLQYPCQLMYSYRVLREEKEGEKTKVINILFFI